MVHLLALLPLDGAPPSTTAQPTSLLDHMGPNYTPNPGIATKGTNFARKKWEHIRKLLPFAAGQIYRRKTNMRKRTNFGRRVHHETNGLTAYVVDLLCVPVCVRKTRPNPNHNSVTILTNGDTSNSFDPWISYWD